MKILQLFLNVNPILGIAVVALVIVAVVPNLRCPVKDTQLKWALGDVRTGIPQALTSYYRDMGTYPSTFQGLMALLQKPINLSDRSEQWNGPYLIRPDGNVDPWGNPYVYVYPGIKNTKGYDIASLGPDGKPSKDDIKNWGSLAHGCTKQK